jgi:hypothetical protein
VFGSALLEAFSSPIESRTIDAASVIQLSRPNDVDVIIETFPYVVLNNVGGTARTVVEVRAIPIDSSAASWDAADDVEFWQEESCGSAPFVVERNQTGVLVIASGYEATHSIFPETVDFHVKGYKIVFLQFNNGEIVAVDVVNRETGKSPFFDVASSIVDACGEAE